MNSFKDHFSSLADDYVRHRPRYPDALFQYLASLTPSRSRAWDCATGSGQAAEGLAPYFERIVATDASAEQIAAAQAALCRANIEYRVAAAEVSDLEDASIDLCTVAQSLHWFDFEQFYSEVRRVVKPGGVLAVWTYAESEAPSPIHQMMHDFYARMRPYFPPERQWVDEHYATIPFPFDEIASPEFFMEAQWTLEDIQGYYRSWSAVKEFRKRYGADPTEEVQRQSEKLRGNFGARIPVRWRLYCRIGRV